MYQLQKKSQFYSNLPVVEIFSNIRFWNSCSILFFSFHSSTIRRFFYWKSLDWIKWWIIGFQFFLDRQFSCRFYKLERWRTKFICCKITVKDFKVVGAVFSKHRVMKKINCFNIGGIAIYIAIMLFKKFSFLFTVQENCAEIIVKSDGVGKWNDVYCSVRRGYICQTQKGRFT